MNSNQIYIHNNKIYFSTKDGLFDLDRISLFPLITQDNEKVKNIFDFAGNNITNEIMSNTLYHLKKELLDRGIGVVLSDDEFKETNKIL